MPDSSNNKWNDWTNLNQKYTDQVVTEKYVQGNERAWKNYQERLQMENEVRMEEYKEKQMNHDKTRYQFHQQMLKNYNKNVKIKTIKRPRDNINLDQNYYQLSNVSDQKTQPDNSINGSHTNQSKLNSYLSENFQCLRTNHQSELKGMLIREIDF